jgi:hypothetical protein
LILAFECLGACIISIYNADSQTARARNQTYFAHLELIEELAEKLSILLQRIIYHSPLTALCQLDTASLRPLQAELLEINKSSGGRHALITANLASMLEQLEGQ